MKEREINRVHMALIKIGQLKMCKSDLDMPEVRLADLGRVYSAIKVLVEDRFASSYICRFSS
jgi:hypothetical protein